MQNNSLVELKLKANEFIQDYQRQVTQRQYQKQKLKQNIMLQIMSNRHKSQSSKSSVNQLDQFQIVSQQSKFKKSLVAPVSQDRNIKYNKSNTPQYPRSNSVPNALPNQQQQQQKHVEELFQNQNDKIQSAQITFKMSKSRPGFQYQPYQSKKQQSEYCQQQQPHQIQYLDNNQTLRQQKSKSNKSIQSIEQPKKKSTISTKKQPINPYLQKSNKYQTFQNKMKDDEQSSETQKNFHIQEQIQEHKPVFLTLDQNQSVQISQQNKNKNYAFDIAMEKSQPIQDIQQLRKKKIQQMQKKRLQRMEQFKKSQQAKKSIIEQKDNNKRSNSSLRVSNRINPNNQGSKGSEQIQIELAKSKGKRKTNQKQQKINLSYQNITQQSHYNMKQPPQQPQRSNYMFANQDKDSDYQQTPKTVNSQYRVDKSKGKNTIFRQSPKRPDKSASKYLQEPKIEPKERKNTFNKQSNKKLMITAINACLPGQLNRKQRQKLSQVIEKQASQQFFVFLFKEYTRKIIKAIYVLDSSQAFISKVYGDKAPQQIYSQNVNSFYRFDSGSRDFKKLDGNKSFSYVVHAVDLIT